MHDSISVSLKYVILTIICLTEFDPDDCPKDCTRPCEKICPANAIFKVFFLFLLRIYIFHFFFNGEFLFDMKAGVINERCYGCGRCFPVCPYDKISLYIFFILNFLIFFSLVCVRSSQNYTDK